MLDGWHGCDTENKEMGIDIDPGAKMLNNNKTENIETDARNRISFVSLETVNIYFG